MSVCRYEYLDITRFLLKITNCYYLFFKKKINMTTNENMKPIKFKAT